jgi:ATP-dependent Lon protease
VIKLVEKESEKIVVKASDVRGYLGVPPFAREKTLSGVGIVTGLAWTSVGGATLPVEARLVDHYAKGFSLTGNLGNVMKESASIALSYVASNLARLCSDVPANYFEKANIHLHVPEGATPKDGPSAGITMASALLSLVLNRAPKVNFAMTGELSLTGNVLAIGGIREKVIAAKRVGISNLIVPNANREDVAELPDYVREGVNFNYVDTYDEVASILFDIGKKK